MSEQEVTISEVRSKFNLVKYYEYTTGWSADLSLVDKETGATHDFNLSWDRINGYDIEFHNPLSDTLIDMKNRPEFEYVLDCIMREDEDSGD